MIYTLYTAHWSISGDRSGRVGPCIDRAYPWSLTPCASIDRPYPWSVVPCVRSRTLKTPRATPYKCPLDAVRRCLTSDRNRCPQFPETCRISPHNAAHDVCPARRLLNQNFNNLYILYGTRGIKLIANILRLYVNYAHCQVMPQPNT